jgi:signal transduction histidine kinase
MIATSVAVAIILTVGFLIYRSITTPIDCMKSAVKEIAKGNFDTKVEGEQRNDELGELARDICRMKEDLKEKDKMKDEFISVASHELRTPIQPILSYTDLAARGVIGKDQAFHVVTLQARRLKQLTDDILDVSRIDGHRLVLMKERFYLDELITRIIDERKPSLNNQVSLKFKPLLRNVRGQTHGAANEQILVHADKARITQVLTNIIVNAIKFTKKGSIDVGATMIDGGEAVEISISDTGPGIPIEIFPTLFTKFSTKSVANGTEHGTGLGLFICKGIVEAHGGTIAALNNSGGGATFRMVLPLLTFRKEPQEEPAQSVTASGRKMLSTAGSSEKQPPVPQLSAVRAGTEQISANSASKK